MELKVSLDRSSIIRIGISSCLLGQNVRFDGGHKRDPFLVGTFGRFVEWVPVCSELELGLGVPRESIRLERHGDGTHLVAPAAGPIARDRCAHSRAGVSASWSGSSSTASS